MRQEVEDEDEMELVSEVWRVEEAVEEADEEYVKQPGVEHLFLLLDPLMQCFTVLRRRKQRMG